MKVGLATAKVVEGGNGIETQSRKETVTKSIDFAAKDPAGLPVSELEPSPDDATLGTMKRTTGNSGMKAVGTKRHRTDVGSNDLRQVLTCFSMKTLVVMSIYFLCLFVNFTSRTHASAISDIKEVWHWIEKIIKIDAENTFESLAEHNRLKNDLDDYKLNIICNGGKIFSRQYTRKTERYTRDGTLDWGERITVELSNPFARVMGVFLTSKGNVKHYDSESGEWIKKPIPKKDWEDEYIRNGNYSFTEEQYFIDYKLLYRGEDYAPYGADGISEWIDADFVWTVLFDSFRTKPSEILMHAQIKYHLRNKYTWVGANLDYDIAEVRLAGIYQSMDENYRCDPAVSVFTHTILEVKDDAANNDVKTELTKPRDYIVRLKCEFTMMWNQRNIKFEIPTRMKTSYRYLKVPAGGVGASTHEYVTDLFNGERYSVAPSIEGNAKRRLVATKHAHCTHKCEIHDDYSSEQTISNSECRPVCQLYNVLENPLSRTGGTLLNPYEEYNCVIHGDGDLSRVCADNRTRRISAKQAYSIHVNRIEDIMERE